MKQKSFEERVLADLADTYGLDRDNVEGILQAHIEDYQEEYDLAPEGAKEAVVVNTSANIADEIGEAIGMNEDTLEGWDAFMAQLKHEVAVLEQTKNIKDFVDWVSLFLDVQDGVKKERIMDATSRALFAEMERQTNFALQDKKDS